MSDIELINEATVAISSDSTATEVVTETLLTVIVTNDQGPPGLQGVQGIQGPIGGAGSPGPRGFSILNGTTAPTSGIGQDGDFYFNTATLTIYGPRAAGAWGSGTSVAGPAGVNGHTIYSGTTVPSSGLGADGDLYLDTQYGGVVGSYGIFGPKASGSWGAGHSLQGAAGIDGATLRYGAGPPSSLLGNDQDTYIDVSGWMVYSPKATGSWPPGVSMIGPAGAAGATIRTGSTTPPASGTGVNGDYYFCTSTGVFWGPKAAGAWPGSGTSLVGPTGSAGTNGTNGTNGNTLISGVGGGFPSSSLGVNGDYYLDYSTWKIFGPKAAGAWPAAVNIIGPQGATGTNGVDGNTVLSGSGDPSSFTGFNGNFYINTTSWKIFGPKTSGAWGSGIPMVGTGFAYQNHELIYTSATQITLIPKNGNTIKIAGSVYNISAFGVLATNSGKSASTLYYVYAFVSSGTVTLEMSTTGHSTDTTAGNEGVEIKTGDNTRTLVGMVYMNGSAQFSDTAASRCVRSWMNDRGVSGQSGGASVVSTTSTSIVELDTGMRCSALLWANELYSAMNVSQSFANVANTIAYNYLLLNGTAIGNAGIGYSINANTQMQGVSIVSSNFASDGINTFSMGMASSAGTTTANYASRALTFQTIRRP